MLSNSTAAGHPRTRQQGLKALHASDARCDGCEQPQTWQLRGRGCHKGPARARHVALPCPAAGPIPILVLYNGSHITRGDLLAAMAHPYLGGSPWPPSQVVEDYILSPVCQPDRLPSSL